MRRARVTVSPETFRLIALVALVATCLIVVTGGAVRITGSGLGCSDWPNCEPGKLVHAANHHQLIEQANRIVSGLVVIVAVLALVAARLRTPRRRDLTWLSVGLIAGVLGQVVLGGLTVIFELRPGWVMAHFLLSMVLIVDAAVLHWRSGQPDGARAPVVRREIAWLTRAIAGLGAAVLVLGTIVTGTGPHSGDTQATRFDLDLRTVAQIHADTVMLLIGLTIALGAVLWAGDRDSVLRRHYVPLVGVMLAQATVGFTQYAMELPGALVELHVLGATLFWVAAVRLDLATRAPVQAYDASVTRAAVAAEELSPRA